MLLLLALQDVDAQSPELKARLEARRRSRGSDSVFLRVSLVIPTRWHIGANRPGAIGVPTRLAWQLPSGWRVAGERWPAPSMELVGKDTSFIYAAPIGIDVDMIRGRTIGRTPLRAVLSYGLCRDVCMPGFVTLTYRPLR